MRGMRANSGLATPTSAVNTCPWTTVPILTICGILSFALGVSNFI